MSIFDTGIDMQLEMCGDTFSAIIDQATLTFSGIIEKQTVIKTSKNGSTQIPVLETTLTVSNNIGDQLVSGTLVLQRGKRWTVREPLDNPDYALSTFALVAVK